jgi:predicted component of type VI protein secretion system
MAFDITKEVTVLGRDVSNDIVIGDSEISRQHSRISRTPGGYVLEDLGSTNGTYINGVRLAAPQVLNPGDTVGLGENVTLMFNATSPEAAATVMGAAARAVVQAPRAPYPPPPPGPATPAAILAGRCPAEEIPPLALLPDAVACPDYRMVACS